MSPCYSVLIIIGIIILFILIFGLPRKKSVRKPNIEGIEDPEVAKAFAKMTNILPFKILRKKVIARIYKLNPTGRLFDVGCGSGNLIIEISEKFPHLELIGMDISAEILDRAKLRAIEKQKKIEFKEGSIEKLPFADESVDFIVSTFSLHHWINPQKAFQEIYRVLKKEGVALIFDFRRDSRKFFYGFLTFITKIVAPKPLKGINEPLGSIQSSYTLKEVENLLLKISIVNHKISPALAWMYIQIKK
ncbi:MAG: class I SAM-dependent methyltransferase [Promethearchaeota archaeon]